MLIVKNNMTEEKKINELITKLKEFDYDWIAQNNLFNIKNYIFIIADEVLKSKPSGKFVDDNGNKIKAQEFWIKIKDLAEKLC